ncbi:hypothetical protein BJX63DRAFT_417284 [Aspergillus granulosus]|uniref:Uncharacterized protein n=1 Tax=Aspergillus granulosus TaxID=176169 RepID=A0ABR4GR69_9EURO
MTTPTDQDQVCEDNPVAVDPDYDTEELSDSFIEAYLGGLQPRYDGAERTPVNKFSLPVDVAGDHVLLSPPRHDVHESSHDGTSVLSQPPRPECHRKPPSLTEAKIDQTYLTQHGQKRHWDNTTSLTSTKAASNAQVDANQAAPAGHGRKRKRDASPCPGIDARKMNNTEGSGT